MDVLNSVEEDFYLVAETFKVLFATGSRLDIAFLYSKNKPNNYASCPLN